MWERCVCVRVLLFSLAGLTALAQLAPPGDKSGGEEEQILRREQWFDQTRGLNKELRPDLKRKAAIEAAKAMLVDERNRGNGATWTEMGPSPMTMLSWVMGPVAGRVAAVAVNPNDVDEVYVGTASGGLWKTSNGGTTWTPLFDEIGTQTIGSVFIDPADTNTVWVGTGEQRQSCASYFGLGLFKSIDGGASFLPMNGSAPNALELSYIAAIAVDPNNALNVLVGGHGFCQGGNQIEGGLYRSVDGGLNWTELIDGSVNDIIADPANPGTFYTVIGRTSLSGNGVYKSTDSGASWTRLETGLPFGTQMQRARLAMSPSDSQVLYALVNQGGTRLYQTLDGGSNWTQKNASACEGQCSYNLCLSVHPTDPDTLLIGSIRHAISTNGGQSLNYLTTGWGSAQKVHQDTHVVLFDRTDGNRYWVGSDGGIWRTEDGGSNFINMNGNLNITQFYDIAVHPLESGKIFGGAQDNSSQRTAGTALWNVTIVTGDGFMNLVDPLNSNTVFQSSYPSGGRPNVVRSTTGGDPGTFSFLSGSGLGVGEPWPWVTPMAISADGAKTQTYLFIGSNRVYISSNSASSWTPLSGAALANSSFRVITPQAFGSAIVVYAGSSGGQIFRCDDALAATPVWSEVTGDYPGGSVSDIFVDPSDPNRVFVTRAGFGGNKLFRSTIGGTTWQAVGANIPDVPANAVALDPMNLERVFVGSDVGVFESTDGGDTFQSMMENFPLGSVVTDLEVDDNPHLLTAGTYGRGAWQVPLVIAVSVEAGPDVGGCVGDPIMLQANASNGQAPFTWDWRVLSGPDMDNGQFSSTGLPNPDFVPTAGGTYVLQVEVTDSLNTPAIDQITLQAGTPEGFFAGQLEHWYENSGSPNWSAGYDRNGNLAIDVPDMILQVNGPVCN